jgi:acyl carrier protein
MRDSVTKIVKNSIEELNQFRSSGDEILFSEDMVLFGAASTIDSLDLVSIITEVEEHLIDELNFELSLTDDRALAREPSPYDSVRSIVDYIIELMLEGNVSG